MRLITGHSHTVYEKLHFLLFFLKHVLILSLRDQGGEENMKQRKE